MTKRRRTRSTVVPRRSSGDGRERFNTPFARLGDMLTQIRAEADTDKGTDALRLGGKEHDSLLPRSSNEDAAAVEDCLFRKAMAGVEPLDCSQVRVRPPGPLAKPPRRPLIESELEAYAELVDLVSGEGSFDIQYTDEYVEGMVVGADPEILEKLRSGSFSIQAHLDLHGMTAEQARQALERFILASVLKGLRCVLIIHGRGLNSREQIPILKQHMASWLKRGRLKRLVLAFTTARPCDGGTGALYVLLRKRRPEMI